MRVEKGYFVHYKGGIYFVHGCASNGDTHDDDDQLVIYEAVALENGIAEGGSKMRFRTVEDFIKEIDWRTGLSDEEALAKGVENRGQEIPRFQAIVGWNKGRPLVLDPGGRNDLPYTFVPQLDNPGGVYQGVDE